MAVPDDLNHITYLNQFVDQMQGYDEAPVEINKGLFATAMGLLVTMILLASSSPIFDTNSIPSAISGQYRRVQTVAAAHPSFVWGGVVDETLHLQATYDWPRVDVAAKEQAISVLWTLAPSAGQVVVFGPGSERWGRYEAP